MKRYLPTRGRARHRHDASAPPPVQAKPGLRQRSPTHGKVRVSQKNRAPLAAPVPNSPYIEGRRGEALSMRARVWLDWTGSLGPPPLAVDAETTYADYRGVGLDIPMFW